MMLEYPEKKSCSLLTKTGKPDLDFMEAYCKEREQQLIEKYKAFIGRIVQTGGG